MKKNIFSLFVICLFATTSFAQRGADEAVAITEKLTTLYSLTNEQIPEMQKIQERKYRNLGEIAELKDTDLDKYILKLRSISTGTDNSTKRMLTEEQRIIFDQKRVENRHLVAVKYKEMKAGNVLKAKMDESIIALELEKLDNH